MSKYEICSEEKCTGCALCVNVCPVNAIHMEYNKQGILFPIVELQKCINCKKCKEYCSKIHKSLEFYSQNKVYAVYAQNTKERKSSTSGGVAAIFYKNIIAEGGYGIGTIFQSEKVELSMIKSEKDILLAKGSKYVQGYVNKIYIKVKELLLNGKTVLFIGTPCQAAALKILVGERENLIIVDLICHGTPSQIYMLEHIKKIVGKKEWKIVKFRGWGSEVFFWINGICGETLYKGNKINDMYVRAFLNGLTYRESCYQCQYAQKKRISDITIGDFWGIGREKLYPYNREKGVSLVITHTKKGEKFFNICQKECKVMERTIQEALIENEQLNAPSVRPHERDVFLEAYPVVGFDKAVELAIGTSDNHKLILTQYCISIIQDIIKSLLGPVIIFYIKKFLKKFITYRRK